LDYFIKKCKGPCQGLQSRDDYGQIIERVRKYLKGRTDSIVAEMKSEMQQMSEKMDFEEAAFLRDKIQALENYRNSQKIVQGDKLDRDVLGLARENEDGCIVLFRIREGKVIGKIHRYLSRLSWKENKEVIEFFLNSHYQDTADLPSEIFIQEAIAGVNVLEEFLNQKKGARVRISVPKIGEKKKLIQLTVKNAQYLLDELKIQKSKTKDKIPFVIEELKKELGLAEYPKHIECFDISNIQGTDPVASMVCFLNGKPRKSEYRRFRIKSKSTPDDFAMMREAVSRRYKRVLDEKKSLPDLIMVDGGKGQLSSALAVLKAPELCKIPVIGLAKRLEEIFRPGNPEAQMLPRSSPALRLLQQIRDEAHRFAINYHRLRRSKRTITSVLDQIPGVGISRRKHLIKAFGSVKKISTASVNDITEKTGFSEKLATEIFNFFIKY